MIIDAHHHVWDPRTARHAWLGEFPPLDRPFSLADFEQASAPEGVTAGVLVQVLPSAEETAHFLALADGAAGRIAGVVGWADLASEGIADELARPEVRRGLQAVGAADIASGCLEPWATLIAELARRPNIVCKLSGLVTEAGAGWTMAQLMPYASHLLNCFGPQRLMFGSDWPVCTLTASYRDVLAAARTMISWLDQAERMAVLAGTAVTAYGLPPG